MTAFEYGIGQPVVQPAKRGFALDRANGKVGGVCAGLARWMGVNERTIRRRLNRICERLHVSTPVQAVVWAVRHGVI